MNSGWDRQQREWLQALGHELLLPITHPGTAGVDTGSAAAPDARHTHADSPLLRALLRAAARRDASELAWLPDPASLRGNPVAKRQLWPRLRALRRPPG